MPRQILCGSNDLWEQHGLELAKRPEYVCLECHVPLEPVPGKGVGGSRDVALLNGEYVKFNAVRQMQAKSFKDANCHLESGR